MSTTQKPAAQEKKPDKRETVARLKAEVKRMEAAPVKTGTEVLDGKIQQVELRMMPVARTRKGFGYHYAPLTEILSHLNGALKELGLMWTAWSDIREIAGQPVCVCTVQIRDLVSGQHRESVHGYPLQADAQKVGSAETYFRRYSLVSLFGIPIQDDDGQETTGRPAPRSARYQKR